MKEIIVMGSVIAGATIAAGWAGWAPLAL